jgi:hypothetical protein
MPNDTDRTDLFGGIALVIATFVAREVANSGLGRHYNALLR